MIDSVLLPNRARRLHWAQCARARKDAKSTAWKIFYESFFDARTKIHPLVFTGRIKILWNTKTKRHPDPDNCLAALKPVIDGMITAGLFEDDSELQFMPIEFCSGGEPYIVFEIEIA